MAARRTDGMSGRAGAAGLVAATVLTIAVTIWLSLGLYDQHETRRHVYVLASDLRPGDSGGGLVNTDGVAIGVAFAIAPDRPGTAYALTSDELRPVLATVGTAPVNTGPCLSEG